jgi:hypothetical protein
MRYKCYFNRTKNMDYFLNIGQIMVVATLHNKE